MANSRLGQVPSSNSDGCSRNRIFRNVAVATAPVKTICVGGQGAADASGRIVGKGNMQRQAEQVLDNLQVALQAGGADLENVVEWKVYVVQGQPLQPAFEVFQRLWEHRPSPPAVSVTFVSALPNSESLLEMAAVAVVPTKP